MTEIESCKGCPNICIMYDIGMRGCKDKMKGVKNMKRKSKRIKLKLLKLFVKWYRKWVMKECPHLCCKCEYKKDCKNDDGWWLDINTSDYYPKKNDYKNTIA